MSIRCAERRASLTNKSTFNTIMHFESNVIYCTSTKKLNSGKNNSISTLLYRHILYYTTTVHTCKQFLFPGRKVHGWIQNCFWSERDSSALNPPRGEEAGGRKGQTRGENRTEKGWEEGPGGDGVMGGWVGLLLGFVAALWKREGGEKGGQEKLRQR